jgi:Mg/Co/Ni transporter MgtE
VADTLEYLSSDEAADILEEVPEGRASDILEEMRPDMAADVVGDLDAEKAEQLLQLMEPEESEEVRDLLAYPRESAGGMMTNEFVMLPSQLPAAEALRVIRAMEEPPEFVDYLYVAEVGTQRVRGVVALRDVVFCPDRTTPLERLMQQDLISVHPQTPAEEASALLTTYGLRALPVIDDQGELQGIITFDDALDVLLPEQLRERIGHLFTYRRGHRTQEHMNTENA